MEKSFYCCCCMDWPSLEEIICAPQCTTYPSDPTQLLAHHSLIHFNKISFKHKMTNFCSDNDSIYLYIYVYVYICVHQYIYIYILYIIHNIVKYAAMYIHLQMCRVYTSESFFPIGQKQNVELTVWHHYQLKLLVFYTIEKLVIGWPF